MSKLLPINSNIIAADAESLMSLIHTRMAHLAAIGPVSKADPSTGAVVRGSVMSVPVVGVLENKPGFWSYFFGDSTYTGIRQAVRSAMSDDNIKKVVFYVDSPGGAALGAQEAARDIRELSQKKSTVAVVDLMAASAAYWLASQTNLIVGTESSQVGSVGAMLEWVSVAEAIKEAGVDYELLRSEISPMKNIGSMFEPKTEEARKIRQERVNKLGEIFLADVAQGRGVSVNEAAEKFGRGAMLFAEDAVAAGMMDRVGPIATPSRK